MSEIEVEFSVQIHGERCVDAIKNALKDSGKLTINEKEGRVTIETCEPWSVLHEKIESTGRKAVLSGFGGKSAVCIVNMTGSDVDETPIQGVIRFCSTTKNKAGTVVDGAIDGLSSGLHGLHIHESGDMTLGCASTGEHYNPRGSPHGDLEDDLSNRHAGDLGNIRSDSNSRATFRFYDPHLEVWDIIGRSLVITEGPDDLGRGDDHQSKVDGNSGRGIACGIIARSAGIMENFKKLCACDGVTIWDERSQPRMKTPQKL